MAALISAIPIALLFILMMGFKVSGWKSALITLVVTILLALFATPALGIVPEKYADVPIVGITIWSVFEGFLKACFPIILIIICAIFSYNILCETKEIETIKTQFTQLTSDKGLLVLLLTWGLGGVLEGMAGFGTAVAIPAAILITGGMASHEMLCSISTYIIIQLSLMFYITPFIILMMTDKTKVIKNLSLALFVGTFSIIIQFSCAFFLGPETPAILGSVGAIIAMLIYNQLFLRHKTEKDAVLVEKQELDAQKEARLRRLNEILEQMAQKPEPQPAKVRNYAMACKPQGVRLAWECNFKHALHSSPCGCAKPQLGGKWIILGKNSRKEIKDDL